VELSIVIPAYNEARRLPKTLAATRAYLQKRGLERTEYEILVVDDGSKDDTVSVVGAFPGVTLLSYGKNQGKGAAVRYGVLHAQGKHILFMDADLATPIEEIEKLERALEYGAQMAIGSRPLKESNLLIRQPWWREACGRGFNKVVQVLATPGIEDTQCGFKLLTYEAAQDIFARCELNGFSFDVEALFLARRLGYKIGEIPVVWAHQEGAAAFSTRGQYVKQGLRMLRDLFRIRQMHRAVRPVAKTQVTA
jgi:dolichyl-phosphate beta-glucosyltransferase